MLSKNALRTIFCVSAAETAVLYLMVSSERGLWCVDLPVARWAARLPLGLSSRLARYATQIGSTAGLVGVATLVVLMEQRRGLGHRVGSYLLVVIASNSALVNALKTWLSRDRPHLSPLVRTASSSFPSGHTTSAAATYACFALLLGRGRSELTQWWLVLIAAVVAVAVGATRVILGVHWLTDVLAGLGLGWASAALLTLLFAVPLGLETQPGQDITHEPG